MYTESTCFANVDAIHFTIIHLSNSEHKLQRVLTF